MKQESKLVIHPDHAELVDVELVHYSELQADAQERAVDYFFKYELGYLDENGYLEIAREHEKDDERIRKLIIKSIDNDTDMFEEDGTRF